MPSKEILMIFNIKWERRFYYEKFSVNITNIVTRDKNIANSCGKEIKQNMLWKKITLKVKITTIYVERKHKMEVAF